MGGAVGSGTDVGDRCEPYRTGLVEHRQGDEVATGRFFEKVIRDAPNAAESLPAVRSDIAIVAQVLRDYLDGRMTFECALAAHDLADSAEPNEPWQALWSFVGTGIQPGPSA